MRHYSETEWQLFINNGFDELSRQKMQEHLLSCDDCMTLYLNLIDESSTADEIVFKGFIDSVMELVHKENIESECKRLKQKRINTFIYYVSAASITLFLMNAGVFQTVYKSLAYETSRKQSLFTNGWTGRLTEGTSKFINGIINITEGSF